MEVVLHADEPINEFLREMHGPTSSVSHTMARLVPFPLAIASLPDADLLDLSVSFQVQPATGQRPSARVTASARYATSARPAQIDDFYAGQLRGVGSSVLRSTSPQSGLSRVLEAVIAPGPAGIADKAVPNEMTFRVSIDPGRGYRSVKVSVVYEHFDHQSVFDRLSRWHEGIAPVTSACSPTGVDVSTFASGRQPTTTALYSTHFDDEGTPLNERRTMVDERLREMDWAYREPREGILFMNDDRFPAETLISGDDSGSTVTFVGEFQLR